ncbi:MAG: hypothetical protein P4L51_04580 [Puia sp.]|nr:hypothetical protein [Puia sp.]
MSSKVFLQTLQNKLRGGNARSIHLNALPGRLAARLDLKQLDLIREGLAGEFIHSLLNEANFTFPISFNSIDLNQLSTDHQKKLLVLAKRLDAIVVDNDDYYKEHGMNTFAFGYPILIKRSTKDPTKVIKAPLFIWPLEAVKSKKKVNEWTMLRNRQFSDNGKIIEADIHSVAVNDVLVSFIKTEDDILLPGLPAETMEDMLLDSQELLKACAEVLHALNPGTKEEQLAILSQNFGSPVNSLPEAAAIDPIANNNAYIHFGGVFGLFRSQKESIITDITRLLERIDEFQFDNLKVECISTTPFSAVDTDPSQQAIIGALGVSPNQVIQGPPGTGKSQSLTALITNALANNLKCLVVCEKKTALDVIKQNLERRSEQLGSLVAVIDDVNDDREALVDSVRERNERLYSVLSAEQAAKQYESATRTLSEYAGHINTQHVALGKRLFRGEAWTLLVGRYLQLLRKFGTVPLKNSLSAADFRFQQDEEELDTLTSLLKKADNLYHQSESVRDIFACLHPHLFANMTVGDARLQIDRYIHFARPQIALIETEIREEQAVANVWKEAVYAKLPVFLREQVIYYLAFLDGRPMSPNPFPAELMVESFLTETQHSLDRLQAAADHFTQTYGAHVNDHYRHYAEDLQNILTDYSGFIQDNLNQFGESFLRNDRMARFKTRLLGLFSAKYKTVEENRLLVREKIAAIRAVHTRHSYIDHTYNDQVAAKDLRIYVDNIKALQDKLNAWQKTYPAQVGSYLDYISETSLHPAFPELKPPLRTLFYDLTDLAEGLRKRCDLPSGAPVTDLGSFRRETERLQSAITGLLQLCQTVRDQFAQREIRHLEIVRQIDHLVTGQGGPEIFETFFPAYKDLPTALDACDQSRQLLDRIQEAMPAFRTFHAWKSFFQPLAPEQQGLILTVQDQIDQGWGEAFTCWYLFTLLRQSEPSNLPRDEFALGQFREQKTPFNRAQVSHILAQWGDRQRKAVRDFTNKGHAVNSLFNKKGSKGMRRNSLRMILHTQFDLFTSFFPVLLVNPSVCSSILPLQEGLFDVIIFDEASQLRLEDTFAALLRGKAKVVSGDKHQMPPSSYFQSQGALLDPTDEDETDDENEPEEIEEKQALQTTHRNLADSESLLTYAEDKGFRQSYLDIHYRSKHPALIDFSNHQKGLDPSGGRGSSVLQLDLVRSRCPKIKD